MKEKNLPPSHISIKTLGQAVDIQKDIIDFLHKNYPKLLWLIYTLLTAGIGFGIYSLSTQKTIKSNKIIPSGEAMFSVMPNLYADQKAKEFFRIDSRGELFVWEKSYGVVDSNFQVYKIQGKPALLVVNRKKSEATFLDDISDLK